MTESCRLLGNSSAAVVARSGESNGSITYFVENYWTDATFAWVAT